MALINQHQLAAIIHRSRATIANWARDGMPVAERAGQGKPTLYDLAAVRAWMTRTCKMAGPAPAPAVQTSAPIAAKLLRAEIALGRALERALVPCLGLMMSRGIEGSVALQVFDEIVVAIYSALELECGPELGGRDSTIPIFGDLELLMDDGEGRPALLQRGRECASRMEGAPVHVRAQETGARIARDPRTTEMPVDP
jgi:hypothetical protein